MVFESLYDSARKGELILVEGGLCRFHLRRDGQLTVREIISTSPGAGSRMLRMLLAVPGADVILAKCPEDLPACRWYEKKGFTLSRTEKTKSGRVLNVYTIQVINEERP